MDYRELIAYTISDPTEAFQAALESDDPVAIALLSILDRRSGGQVSAERFSAFASRHGATPAVIELVLGVLEHAATLTGGLTEAVDAGIKREYKTLPLETEQAQRVEALVCDRQGAEQRRASLLAWLSWAARKVASRAAAGRLADLEEPYGHVAKMAIAVLGVSTRKEDRRLLEAYAGRHLEPGVVQVDRPQPNPEASFYVLDALQKPSDEDVGLIARILAKVGERGLQVGNRLDKLIGRMTVTQIASLVQQLGTSTNAVWFTGQLLPALIDVRAKDIAPTVGEEWWPRQCLGVLAATAWEKHDDRLYPVVLEHLYKTNDESACTTIRQRVSVRCRNTTSVAARDMPRAGARVLLKLALRGEIPTDDPDLTAGLAALDLSLLWAEIEAANWKSTERARRVGHIVAQAKDELLEVLIEAAIEMSTGTALAVIEGATAPLLEPRIDGVLRVADDNQIVLTALCQISESAAGQTFMRWQTDHSMAAFRALAATSRAEERLTTIPSVVRMYQEHTPAERAELLAAYGHRNERIDVLCGILADRSAPPPRRPHTDDLVQALSLLGEHLARGLEPERVLDAIRVVCSEERQQAVRKAAYAALSEGRPTAAVVELLLERQNGEAPPVRPAVSAALATLGDKLDAQAADSMASSRAEAAEQLAYIDPGRAVVHARSLLEATDAEDRRLAARILGASGSPEDAERLEGAAHDEPSPEVRSEIQRAIRRLRIGDSAAAHERIGELAGVGDYDAWVRLDPATLYGPWVGPMVAGLDRVARADSAREFGTAIDQLDEIAKALLFRAIELAGGQVGVNETKRTRAATNDLDYGDVLGWQQVNQNWRWVHNFGSLHELRTEHIAARRSVAPPPERTDEDLKTAYTLFKLGARPCCDLIAEFAGHGTAG
jgi:hypothetical protein